MALDPAGTGGGVVVRAWARGSARRRLGSGALRMHLAQPGCWVSSPGDRPPFCSSLGLWLPSEGRWVRCVNFHYLHTVFFFGPPLGHRFLLNLYGVQTLLPQKYVRFHAGAVWYFVSGNFMPPPPKFSLVAQCHKGSTTDWPESFPWRGSANTFHAILTCMVPLGSAVEFRCSGSLHRSALTAL